MKMFDPSWWVDEYMKIAGQDIVPNWVKAILKSGGAEQGVVTNVSTALQGAAIGVAALFFFLSLLELGMSERANPETVVKFFAKFAMSIFFILSTPKFIEYGGQISDAVMVIIDDNNNYDQLAKDDDKDSKDSSVRTSLEATVKDMWLFQRMMLAVDLQIFQMGMLFASVSIATILISRRIELAMRGVFLPIAMGFVTTEGWQGGAIRYIKKYIAIWLQGPMIMLVFRLSGSIALGVQAAAMGSDGWSTLMTNNPFVMLSVNGAITMGIIGAVKASQQVVNDVMGT